jgi:hypothetical protein
MNNYTLSRTPATLSVAASVLLFSYTALALAHVDAMDRVAESSGKLATIRSGNMVDVRVSPTLGANVRETFHAEANQLFASASDAFAAKLSTGVEALGSEFAAVIEEDFWDLVLR